MIFLLRPVSSTRDNYERIAFEYAQDLKDRYKNKTYIDFHELQSESDPVGNFKDEIRKHGGTAYFVAYSHGSENSLGLTTHGEIFGTEDCDMFNNKYCFLVACNAMIRLGPMLVSAGALGVIGYKGEFWSCVDRRCVDYVETLKNCVNTGIIIFLEGSNNIGEIFERIKNLYSEIQEEIVGKKETSESELTFLGMINWNMSKMDYLPK